MKRLVFGVVCGLAAMSCVAEDVASTDSVSSELSGGRRFLVVYRGESVPSDAATKATKAGGRILKSLPKMGIALAWGNDAFAAKLGADASVLSIGGEHYFTADDSDPQEIPNYPEWFTDLQWDMRRIGAPALWARGLPRSSEVAVIDTGVMSDHPELQGQVPYGMTTSYCADYNGSHDSNGYPLSNPSYGYPSYDGYVDLTIFDCAPVPHEYRFAMDGVFHGTHVAGTIGAPLNGIGITGVSPTTKIHAYKVFDIVYDGNGIGLSAFDFPIFAAIDDAVSRGTKVINMSLGGQLDRSIKEHNTAWLAWSRVTSIAFRKGTLIVAAAGNETTNNNGTVAFIPSDLPSVMSVSATGVTQWVGNPYIDDNGFWFGEFTAAPGSDVLTEYSNFGAAVDIAAPGGDCPNGCAAWNDAAHLILSSCVFPAINQDDGSLTGEPEPGWCFAAGTSMAAPHVAGAAAAVRAVYPKFTAGDTRSWLKGWAFPMANRQGFGAGILNVDDATK